MHNNSLFLIAIISIIIISIIKIITANEKKLFYLIMAALFLHLAIIIIMQFDLNKFYNPFVVRSKFFNDGEAYSGNAWLIFNTLKGKAVDLESYKNAPGVQYVSGQALEAAQKFQIIEPKAYQVGFITYLYAIIYTVYGYVPAFINFINACFHLFAALLIFRISKDNFNRTTAYIATALFLFWPTIFYYNSTKLKEALITFFCYSAVSVCMYVKNKIRLIFLIALILTALGFVKYNLLLPLLLVTFIYFWLKMTSFKNSLRKLSIFLFLSIIIIYRCFYYNLLINFLRTCASRHKGFLDTGGLVYSLFIQNKDIVSYNLLDWFFYLLRGWYHFIFEPLFSTGLSPSFIIYFPFKIIFIFLFITSIFGLVLNLRKGNKNNFLLVFFFLIFGSMFALVEANTGTMLRHRDLITPAIFIYSSFYISKFIRPKSLISSNTNEI